MANTNEIVYIESKKLESLVGQKYSNIFHISLNIVKEFFSGNPGSVPFSDNIKNLEKIALKIRKGQIIIVPNASDFNFLGIFNMKEIVPKQPYIIIPFMSSEGAVEKIILFIDVDREGASYFLRTN